jgi:hypothetical protein
MVSSLMYSLESLFLGVQLIPPRARGTRGWQPECEGRIRCTAWLGRWCLIFLVALEEVVPSVSYTADIRHRTVATSFFLPLASAT